MGRLCIDSDYSFGLNEGQNCWRLAPVRGGKFLIDGEAYFADLEYHLNLARELIIIIGWDFDSRIFLSQRAKNLGQNLGRFLESLCHKHSLLEIYILIWDPIYLYALNRQPLQRWLFSSFSKSRIHFILDHNHPLTASHHQKLVIIDDQIAYCGGLDLTSARWDTQNHLEKDERRATPTGQLYPPFHDVGVRIQGDAVKYLSKLARKRWYDASGIPIRKTVNTKTISNVQQDFYDSKVAISRTLPSYLNHPGIREIEAQYIDLIRAARRYIYIENQYFASQKIAKEISASLNRKHGPEIIILTTPSHEGWFESRTMGATRNKLLASIYEQDKFKRLGVFTPRSKNNQPYTLHSKLMIIDGLFAIIGSANLNNRSMGLDSECNLTIVATNNHKTHKAIENLMERLLAEHLHTKLQYVKAIYKHKKSYLKTIQSFPRKDRHLIGYRTRANDWIMNLLSDLAIIDPKKTLNIELNYDRVLLTLWLTNLKPLSLLAIISGSILGLYLFWFTFTDKTHAIEFLKNNLINSPMILIIVVCIYLLLIPLNIQILVIANLTSAFKASMASVVCCLLSMTLSYYLGNVLGPKNISRYFITRPYIIYQRLKGTGLLPVIFTRFFLWLPFQAINIVAGSASVKKPRFFVGSILGVLPKIFIIIGLYTSMKLLWFESDMRGLIFGFVFFLASLLWFAAIINRYRFLIRAWHMER